MIFLAIFGAVVYNSVMNLSKLLFSILVIFSLTSLSMISVTAPSSSHEWYDAECCFKADCKPIESCSELVETKEGWKWDKHIFTKIKPSQDDKCHVCVSGWGVPMCAYIQQGS